MKKIYLLSTFLLIFGNLVFSQLAPIGAKWYYNEPNSTNHNCITYESIQDTIIQSSNCKIIEVKRNNATVIGKEYIKQNGDSIFYYNYYENSFHLLYNFSSKVGDTVYVHLAKFKPTKAFFSYDSINNFRYKIIALDSIQISGNWVKRQKVISLNANDWGFPSAITQEHYILNEIGSLSYFFGITSNITPENTLSLLRCYQDVGKTYKNPAWGYDCDITGIPNHKNISRIFISPNPVINKLCIKSNDEIESIELFTISGLSVLSVAPKNREEKLNLEKLPQGIYFIRIKSNNEIYREYFTKCVSLKSYSEKYRPRQKGRNIFRK